MADRLAGGPTSSLIDPGCERHRQTFEARCAAECGEYRKLLSAVKIGCGRSSQLSVVSEQLDENVGCCLLLLPMFILLATRRKVDVTCGDSMKNLWRVSRRMAGTAAARLPKLASHWLGWGADLIFPPACAACQVEMIAHAGPILLCEDCERSMVAIGASCPRCGAIRPTEAGDGWPCVGCSRHRLRFHAVARLGSYDGLLREAVLRIKREHEQVLARHLGQLLAHTAHDKLQGYRAEVVVPIPMHWLRRTWRGFNSTEVLAAQLARRLRLPMAGHLLRRTRATEPQADLPRLRRFKNVRGAFRVAAHRDLTGARVLLVDDIMTTGATSSEAAKMFLKAGAAYVAVAVLARAEGD